MGVEESLQVWFRPLVFCMHLTPWQFPVLVSEITLSMTNKYSPKTQ